MAKLPVVFKYGSRADYEGLAQKSDEALYFLTDTGEIYRGEVNLARGSHYEIECNNGETAEQAFAKIQEQYAEAHENEHLYAVKDDILVVKRLIANDKYSYTSYVFDGAHWGAMDGNYSADDIYFNDDFVVTDNIGAFKLPEGASNTTLEMTGKNLKQLLSALLAQRVLPEATAPAVSVKFTNSTKSLEVGSKITPAYEASLSAGSYTYGPATGITAKTWSVVDSNKVTRDTATGTFPELTVTDGMSYSVTATATYDAGAIPVDNLGDDAESKQIPAGSDDATVSTKITGYRNVFYGTYDEKGDNGTTSATIRNLTKSGAAPKTNYAYNITIPATAQRAVFAYPATYKDLTEILDKNDSNANIIPAFTKTTVKVEGANGHTAIDYKVYTIDFAGAYGQANTFIVKIPA